MKTAQDVLTGLRAIVEGREGYVYVSPDPSGAGFCMYSTPTGEPSCGVGVYFFANDRELFDKVSAEEWGEDESSQPMVVTELSVLGLERAGALGDYDSQARQLLMIFQEGQDHGYTWGEALADTESRAKALA